MNYTDGRGRPAFIKVDLNFLDRVPVLPPERRPVKHPFGEDVPRFEVQTVSLEELVAAKLVALVRRGLARDLFDVATAPGLEGLDVDVVRTILVVRGATYPPPSPQDYGADAVRRVRSAKWRAEVLPLARRPTELDLPKAQSRALQLLEPAIELQSGHLRFLDALEEGLIQPEALPLKAAHDRIALNPGLHWRLRVGARRLEER
jgi:hypothetical protein